MPTYDYRCTACKHEFELFQSMKDSPKRKCPQCGKNALERLIGIGAAVLFKGSGFYETDYRSKSYQEGAKKESEAAAPKTEGKSEGKSEGKTESKPDSSGESKSKPDTPAKAAPEKPTKAAAKRASPAKKSGPKKAAG
jgi:putative FmdB family regulatory protein